MQDTLGDRMKSQYEDRTRFLLPRRTYTILRLDGKAFHTYTKGLKKPFDNDLYADIDAAIITMLPELHGAKFAYTQSDEVSVLLTDFATPQTSAWFNGNLQKMVSVAASIMTAEFNLNRIRRQQDWARQTVDELNNIVGNDKSIAQMFPRQLAYFDCRVFTIPDRTEVMNYFRWRQQDCVRNSVSMVAQANFSHKELKGKSQSDMHEMLHWKGINLSTNFSDGEKNGRIIVKEKYLQPMAVLDIESEPIQVGCADSVQRTKWVSKGAWEFSKDNGLLLDQIPIYS